MSIDKNFASSIKAQRGEVDTLEPPEPAANENFEHDIENHVYGYCRVRHAKTKITFIRGDNLLKLPYSDFVYSRLISNELLVISTRIFHIEIAGKNLKVLFDLLDYNCLSYIREGGKNSPPYAENGVCVFSITEKDLRDLEGN